MQADAAVITNVGKAHIEGFGSARGVYEGKSEILDAVLARGGIGIVHLAVSGLTSGKRI